MGQQSTADNNHKGPPKFQHLPRARGTPWDPLTGGKNSHGWNHSAKRLKSAWIQTRKIKSKWKAEKRREGIQSTETGSTAPELEIPVSNVRDVPGQKSDHQLDPTEIDAGSDVTSPRSEGHLITFREPIHAAKTGTAVGSSQQKDQRRRSGRHDHQWRRPSEHQGKKPSMKSRMNALLEKIERGID
jgi:hypothetical protein